MIQSSKSVLRKKILKQRQALSKKEWQTKSNLICNRLLNLPLFTQADTIFAYFSFRREVDLNPLFSLNKTWAFPRCVDKTLVWHSWQPGENLVRDKYGIKTPLESASIISIASTDLILVPTVACDRYGYRLGYGGGFYDRLLVSIAGFKIPTVGIAFDFTICDRLPVDSWDIKLNFVCTETTFYNCFLN